MKSRRIRWESPVAHIGEKGNAYKVLVYPTKPVRKHPLGRPRHYWDDNNTKMGLIEIEW
jgi:hypothetical protein